MPMRASSNGVVDLLWNQNRNHPSPAAATMSRPKRASAASRAIGVVCLVNGEESASRRLLCEISLRIPFLIQQSTRFKGFSMTNSGSSGRLPFK
jgi:hypothetical protein